MNAEEFHSLSRQLHEVTERMEVRANPGPPGADRDMTFEEKRKLSVFMGALDADKLDRVIEIISQDQPDLPGKAFRNLQVSFQGKCCAYPFPEYSVQDY